METLIKFITYIMKKLSFTIKIIEWTIIISYPKGAVNIYKSKINSINIFSRFYLISVQHVKIGIKKLSTCKADQSTNVQMKVSKQNADLSEL